MVDVGSQILARFEASRECEFPDIMELGLDHSTKQVTEKFSEALHVIGNEPSMALYRLQEHVRKTLPMLSEKRIAVDNVQQKVHGICYDAEYASNALDQVQRSRQYFNSIDEHISKAIYLKQELEKARYARSENMSIRIREQVPSASSGSLPVNQDAVVQDDTGQGASAPM